MAHDVANVCLRELSREYGKDIDILLRITDTEFREPEINVETIVDNIASLGAFNQKNLTICNILGEYPKEREECEDSIRIISERARNDMIGLISKRIGKTS